MTNLKRNRGKQYRKPIIKIIDNINCPACGFPLGTKKQVVLNGKNYHSRVRCSESKIIK